MNADPRSVVSAQRHRSRKPATNSRITRLPVAGRGAQSRVASSLRTTSLPLKAAGAKVEKLNTSRLATPPWLSSFLFLQRSSDIVTFLLVAATLTVYSWTVYTQQQWTREYRKLETLQRNERHLTTVNEVMKDQLAQQAESPATGLVPPTQANTIFLPSAPQRQVKANLAKTTQPDSTAKSPLGY